MNSFNTRCSRIALIALLAAPFCSNSVMAQKSAQARKIGGKFLCMCGCNQVLTQCNHVGCTTSTSMLKKIDQAVAQGDSEEKITQSFVEEFGTTAYAEPPKSGISLVAWAMPTVYLIVGAVLVVFLIAKWRKTPALSRRTTGIASPHSHISQELLDRARNRAARETED
jgi:cytochrome c-type biogenesis protein CcmH